LIAAQWIFPLPASPAPGAPAFGAAPRQFAFRNKQKMQLDWISPPVLDCKSPHSPAATTHSNRAAVFHLSYSVAERGFTKHLLCHCILVRPSKGEARVKGVLRSSKEQICSRPDKNAPTLRFRPRNPSFPLSGRWLFLISSRGFFTEDWR
jgi:hypothetical protein